MDQRWELLLNSNVTLSVLLVGIWCQDSHFVSRHLPASRRRGLRLMLSLFNWHSAATVVTLSCFARCQNITGDLPVNILNALNTVVNQEIETFLRQIKQ